MKDWERILGVGKVKKSKSLDLDAVLPKLPSDKAIKNVAVHHYHHYPEGKPQSNSSRPKFKMIALNGEDAYKDSDRDGMPDVIDPNPKSKPKWMKNINSILGDD